MIDNIYLFYFIYSDYIVLFIHNDDIKFFTLLMKLL